MRTTTVMSTLSPTRAEMGYVDIVSMVAAISGSVSSNCTSAVVDPLVMLPLPVNLADRECRPGS